MTAPASALRKPAARPNRPHSTAQGDPGRPMFHRVFPAVPLAVRQVLIDVTQRFASLPPDRLSRLELALAEILNNIVEHGYADRPAGVIHLSIVPGDSGLSCAVADDGGLLPTSCLAPRTDPLAEGDSATAAERLLCLPEGGFGWLLIQGLTQNLCHFRENGRNMLAFFLPHDPPEMAPRQIASTG